MARDATTGQPIVAEHHTGGSSVVEDLRCYGCGLPLCFRRAHQRTRQRPATPTDDGKKTVVTTLFSVRGHFAHIGGRGGGADGGGGGCSPESRDHAAAKALLIARPDHPLVMRCGGGCETGERPFDALPATDDTTRRVAEFTVTIDDARQRRLDVAVLQRDDGALVGAIEVYHRHACDDAKLGELQDRLGDRWCEVRASDVIEAVTLGTPIPVLTCSADCCAACVKRRRSVLAQTRTRIIESQRAREEATAAAESLERALGEAVDAEARLAKVRRLEERLAATTEAEALTLAFGKHRGRTVQWVLETDPRYVLWLAKGGPLSAEPAGFVAPLDVVRCAQRLTQDLCRSCGEGLDPARPKWKTLCIECHRRRG